jgi:hypothetical protein
MALFRVSLAGAINRNGAKWRVERSAVLGGTLWLFDLRREGSRDPDSASLFVRFYPSSDAAGEQFARHGNEFIAPVTAVYYQGTPQPPVRFDRPIISHVTLPSLRQSHFVWSGYGSNTRGVISFRQGRVIAQINAPSVSEAEQLGRKIAALRSRSVDGTHRARTMNLPATRPMTLVRIMHPEGGCRRPPRVDARMPRRQCMME